MVKNPANGKDTRDVGLIPGSGRSFGKGNGNPLQCSWASLVPQMVKNPPAMWETWIQSLGQEDPQEQRMATHFSILAWKNPLDRGAWRATVHGGHKESDIADYIHMHARGSKNPHVHGMVKKKKKRKLLIIDKYTY